MRQSLTSAWQEFCALAAGSDIEGKGLRCGSGRRHLLVKGPDGEPILFLNSAGRVNPRAPIRLRNVIVEFDRRYALQDGSATESSGCFTTLRCLPEAVHLHPFFVEMAVSIANMQPDLLSEGQVDDIVEGLINVFRQGKVPSQSTVLGLWGELVLLTVADDLDAWIGAWHGTPTETFDFCFSDKRIEVKSTEKPLREHEFSASQVSGAKVGDFIASVQLKRSSAGHTAIELANEIAEKLNERSRAKFWSLVYATLGEDAISMDVVRFDLGMARQSVVFIPSGCVPCVSVPEKYIPFVSHVRYRANIEMVAKEYGVSHLGASSGSVG